MSRSALFRIEYTAPPNKESGVPYVEQVVVERWKHQVIPILGKIMRDNYIKKICLTNHTIFADRFEEGIEYDPKSRCYRHQEIT
jgi:hypothetical protein